MRLGGIRRTKVAVVAVLSVVVMMLVAVSVRAMRAQQANLGYDDTPMQPNGKWHVHDGTRPQPPMVKPGFTTLALVPAPADAIVLLGDRDDLSAWQMMDKSPATWAMKNGVVETGKGIMRTKAEF